MGEDGRSTNGDDGLAGEEGVLVSGSEQWILFLSSVLTPNVSPDMMTRWKLDEYGFIGCCEKGGHT